MTRVQGVEGIGRRKEGGGPWETNLKRTLANSAGIQVTGFLIDSLSQIVGIHWHNLSGTLWKESLGRCKIRKLGVLLIL
jgi:hypothetical protein